MDKLWLKEGLDLKMVTFACVPTGEKRGITIIIIIMLKKIIFALSYYYNFYFIIEGIIEMVTNAETLRKIQIELGLTGSFKDRPIAEWLAKHNPSALEYERAVANFTGKYHHNIWLLFKIY
jgi:phosphatidylinositol-4-phosphate 3-kinase